MAGLPDEIVVDGSEGIERLSSAYGCQFEDLTNWPVTVVVNADPLADRSVRAFFAALTPESDGTVAKVADYWLVEDTKTSQFYAVEAAIAEWKPEVTLNVKSLVLPDLEAMLPYIDDGSDQPTSYGYSVAGPDPAVLEDRSQAAMVWAMTFRWEIGPTERVLVTFQSIPEGADLYRGKTHVAQTTAQLDTMPGNLSSYTFKMANYQDCPYSQASSSEGVGRGMMTVVCELQPE